MRNSMYQNIPNDPSDASIKGDDWFAGVVEEDTIYAPLPFDASENGLWNGRFVPPPPRPPFLDDNIISDGVTTCDLCTWAWHGRTYSLDNSIETNTGELGWTFTLIIVSIISAILGAIIMVIVIRCKRLKSSNNSTGARQLPWWSRSNRSNAAIARNTIVAKHPVDNIRGGNNGNTTVWTWLSSRRSSSSPEQIGAPSVSPAENHYTHMDDAYSPVGLNDEALYAELDRDSIRSANPSYQNTGYSQCGEMDQEVPIVSSAPSSAYYSDLSTTGATNERAYEVVGLTHLSSPLPNWEASDTNRKPLRLAAINESTNVPSDYV